MEHETLESAKNVGEPFVIGGWQVDPASLRISNNKKTIKLEPKAMAVLDYLACRPNTVVSRQQLEDEVWAGTIVGYDALSNAIIKLRKALGDKARKSKIIETIAKTGYRLIAEVSTSNQSISSRSGIADDEEQITQRGKLSTRPSVAVLPFDNMSGDAEQEYFSDGITEDIITELSRFHELFVISRHSSFVFKNQSTSIGDIGDKLGVLYLVEGSVRRSGKRVRITAQLIEVATGNHLWADRYDRELEDIFSVQDEVARIITATLVGRVGQAHLDRARHKLPSTLDAYDWFVQGRELFHNSTPEENNQACEMIEKVVAIDPSFAPAHALLAEAYTRDWITYWNRPPELSLEYSWTSAKKALTLDDTDSRIQTAISVVYIYAGEHDQAFFHLNRALAINPCDTHALTFMSRCEMYTGNPERAIELITEARRYNPYGIYDWSLVTAYFVAHRYDEAIRVMRAIQNPAPMMVIYMAAVFAQAGDVENASDMAAKYIKMATVKLGSVDAPVPQNWLDFASRRCPFKQVKDREHFLDGLRIAGVPE